MGDPCRPLRWLGSARRLLCWATPSLSIPAHGPKRVISRSRRRLLTESEIGYGLSESPLLSRRGSLAAAQPATCSYDLHRGPMDVEAPPRGVARQPPREVPMYLAVPDRAPKVRGQIEGGDGRPPWLSPRGEAPGVHPQRVGLPLSKPTSRCLRAPVVEVCARRPADPIKLLKQQIDAARLLRTTLVMPWVRGGVEQRAGREGRLSRHPPPVPLTCLAYPQRHQVEQLDDPRPSCAREGEHD